MTTREAARTINAIKCSMVTTPAEHEALTIAERVLWEAEPIKHGRWIYEGHIGEPSEPFYSCSICQYVNYKASKFCPNCGAKMDEEEE